MLPARLPFALALLVLAGCAASPEYRDTNAAVDANPLCASRPDQPNAPVALDCRRESSAVIYSSQDKAEAPDFRRDKDDDPR